MAMRDLTVLYWYEWIGKVARVFCNAKPKSGKDRPAFSVGDRVYWFCDVDGDCKAGVVEESGDWIVCEYDSETLEETPVGAWGCKVRHDDGRAFSMRERDVLRW